MTLDLRARLLEARPLLLDGATGTELERRGSPTGLPLWSAHALLEDPGLVQRIHADYAAAGADVLTANTFRTQRRTLARGGVGERAAELTSTAVALARRAAAEASNRRPVFVVGSAPTLEECPADGAAGPRPAGRRPPDRARARSGTSSPPAA